MKKLKHIKTLASFVVSLTFLTSIGAMEVETPRTSIQRNIAAINEEISNHETEIKSLQLAQQDANKAIVQFERGNDLNLSAEARRLATVHARHHLSLANRHYPDIFQSNQENVGVIINYINTAGQSIDSKLKLIMNAQQRKQDFEDELRKIIAGAEIIDPNEPELPSEWNKSPIRKENKEIRDFYDMN